MEDDRLHVRAFNCEHETCVDCAQKLVRYMASCPLCRVPTEMKVVLNMSFTALEVTVSEGTASQIGPHIFPLPKSESRSMRLMRRKQPSLFADLLKDKSLQFLTNENIIFKNR